jgi:tetratricopeptide (TPR) repeat protein
LGIVAAATALAAVAFRPARESAGGPQQAEPEPPPPQQPDRRGARAVGLPPGDEPLAGQAAASPSPAKPASGGQPSTSAPAPRFPAPVSSDEMSGHPLRPAATAPVPVASQAAAGAGLSKPPATRALLEEEEAVAHRMATDFPDRPRALCLLGDVYQARGRSVEAAKYWETCLKLDQHFAQAHDRLGTLAMSKAEYEEAARRWRAAIAIDPAMAGVHGGLGRALMYLGKPAEAIPELEQEARITPQAYLNFFVLGQAYWQLNAYDKAKQNYERAAALRPDDWHVYYGLASACEKLEEADKAQQYRETFQKLKAADLHAYYVDLRTRDDLETVRRRVFEVHLGAGRAYHDAGKLPAAEEHWRRAAALAPKDTACRLELAGLYQRAGRDEEALQIYEQLRELDPASADYQLNAGVAAARLRRFETAEAAFRKAVALGPRQADAYRALATLYLKTMRNLGEARKLAETAVELQPSAANYFLLSEACDKNGDREKALATLERATRLDPGNPRYQRMYDLLKQRK